MRMDLHHQPYELSMGMSTYQQIHQVYCKVLRSLDLLYNITSVSKSTCCLICKVCNSRYTFTTNVEVVTHFWYNWNCSIWVIINREVFSNTDSTRTYCFEFVSNVCKSYFTLNVCDRSDYCEEIITRVKVYLTSNCSRY